MSETKTKFRVGLIVPSSNVTMETEIPAMLHARELVEPEKFTFHSSRMRMKSVTKEELEAMDNDSGHGLRVSGGNYDAREWLSLHIAGTAKQNRNRERIPSPGRYECRSDS
jgi:hypothetical protein